ncbi:helix-turn-helix transcriptional regulator [Alkalicoccus daliensis]|uniref:Putative transcriptional regulator n=1 Tax=Alkalicoccus daliensis TaxID=745820 RepID=A0A1H0EYC1_9BACI|nr:helix-turn-helix transcriptional regulator [Alkalicoccus daliensis]SDN87417.1 putative transcriptional regulator [Alkalicoccus daliensis]
MKINRVKAARQEKKLSQQKLADEVQVTRQTISLIEVGKYNPTINLCIAICRALDKSLDELFWPEEE